MTQLQDAHLLVVGATGGLGSAIAHRLVKEGVRVSLSGRDEQKLSRLATDLGAAVVSTAAADLTVPGGPSAVAAALPQDVGIDGVVYAAGVVAFGSVAELDDETLDEVLLLNLVAPVRLMRELFPRLEPGSTVVHVSAVVAERPMKGMAAYSASKAALTNFSAAAHAELRRHKIRVLDVRPPHTETGLASHPVAGAAPRLGPGLDPDDVAARIVAAIASDETELPAAAFD
ncbi:SDR family NAD(P)-dependent oxidoreductase [Arthrobacter pigmenti]